MIALLATENYLCDRRLATALFLALKLRRPLFLEGEPGVGKTELAKTLAAALSTALLRLQCYEGLDVAQTAYEWNVARQMVEIRLAEAAHDVDRDRVVLLRNFRFVIGETLWEVPAGTVEVGEPLEACARRELAEETGYTAAKWRSLGFLFASPGVLDEKLHLFVAEDLTPGDAAPEPGEQLQPVTVTFDDAIRMCLNGEIRDAKTITSLLLWERLR